MELNHTCLELLKILHEKKDYTSISELAEQLKMTERTIRYSLDRVDMFLARKNLPLLAKQFGQGVQLDCTPDLERTLQRFFTEATPYQYKFSAKEREQFLTIYLLAAGDRYVTQAEITNWLTVSNGTVAADLVNIEKWLEEKGFSLIKKSRMGAKVKGEEIRILHVCLDYLSEIDTLSQYDRYLCRKPLDHKIASRIMDALFQDLDATVFRRLVKRAEAMLKRVFSDESVGNLLFYLVILTRRRMSGTVGPETALSIDDSISTPEYHVAELLLNLLQDEYHIAYSNGDRINLTAQILSSKSIRHSQGQTRTTPNHDVKLDNIACEMVTRMEQLCSMDFSSVRDELVENLVTHLIPTVYRIRYNQKIVNPIFDELRHEHSQLLQYTAAAAQPLAQYCGTEISDQEISYIGLYFLSAISQQNPQAISRPKVIVACGSGYGTAQIVASQLNRFLDVDIAAVLSGRDVSDMIEQQLIHCDYIISTVDLPQLQEQSYIKVNPIFTQSDYEKILKAIDTRKYGKLAGRYLETANTLVDIVCKYNADKGFNVEQLKYEFLSTLIRTSAYADTLGLRHKDPNLDDLLLPGLIQMDVSCRTWQEVVAAGTSVMEENGYVTDTYKDAIVQNILDFGPAMVMFPGTLISHASPAGRCKKLGFGFISLRHPVSFHCGANDPVRIVFTLSAIDSSSHMNALMQLFQLLSDSQLRTQLFEVRSKDALLKLVRRS